MTLFAGGGEMGALMRAKDWSATPLGSPELWPQSLRAVIRILLTSRYAMWMGWGPELTFFYNDAYGQMSLGAKHPWALGRPSQEVWAEIWPQIGPRLDKVLATGEATWDERLLQGTPAALELRAGKPIAIAIKKPGYLTVKRQLTPAANDTIDLDLQPLNGFEGVWVMPDGQLRELARNGDAVDVYKRKTLTGARDLWRKFAFAESSAEDEVTFATQAEMLAEDGSPDPSCRLTHKIEYHYHLTNQTLDVQAERIETGKRHDGGCFVVRSEPGQRRRLTRADQSTETRWTEPPVGKPAERSVSKESKDKTAKPVKKPPRQKVLPPIQTNNANPPSRPNKPPEQKVAPKPAQKDVPNANEDVKDIPQQQKTGVPPQQQQINEPQVKGDSQVAPPVKPDVQAK